MPGTHLKCKVEAKKQNLFPLEPWCSSLMLPMGKQWDAERNSASWVIRGEKKHPDEPSMLAKVCNLLNYCYHGVVLNSSLPVRVCPQYGWCQRRYYEVTFL